MARTTSKGFRVWDLTSDPYSHNDLAYNWDLLDSLLSGTSDVGEGKSIQNISTFTPGVGGPQTPVDAGDVAISNVALSGYPAWTLFRYDGTNWRPVGPVELQSTVPVTNLFAGRLVMLSAAASNFQANSLIAYSGSSWDYVGPFQLSYTGAGATNINGAGISGDVHITSGNRGLILTDRTTGTKMRLYLNNGIIYTETVT